MDGSATHGFTMQRSDEGIPLFPTLDPKGAPQPGLWWTRERRQALVFCRKIDAQRFMETFTPAAAATSHVVPITLQEGA